jgi:phasin
MRGEAWIVTSFAGTRLARIGQVKPGPRAWLDESRYDAYCKTWYSSGQQRRKAHMMEPKLEVPAEVRELAEKTIDQAEKAFSMFFDAANKSVAAVPAPTSEMSKQALSFTQQNMKAAFDNARRLVHAKDLQEAMQIQSEFLKSQFTNAGEHMRQVSSGLMSSATKFNKS